MRWADWIVQLFQPATRAQHARVRLALQSLEDRAVPHGGVDHLDHVEPPMEEIVLEEHVHEDDSTETHADGEVWTMTGEEGEPDILATTSALIPPPSPLPQLGNRVWLDKNGNGFQDTGERGVSLVKIDLFQGNLLVASTVSDALGAYAFNDFNIHNGTADKADDGLKHFTAYQVRINSAQAVLQNLRPTVAKQGQGVVDELRDSDINATTTGAVINLVTEDEDIYYHYDAGFAPAGSIGNAIWHDANNNGKRDMNEAGIPGVSVRLLDGTGTTVKATMVTDADGNYSFGGLTPGKYVVELNASNFVVGGKLFGFSSSTGQPTATGTSPYEGDGVPDPNASSVDGDDNGTTKGNVICCKPIDIGAEGTNVRTVDFGVFTSASLKGRVFVDLNANGQIDNEDRGLAGIGITASGLAGQFKTRTDATGNYQFASLPAGSYTVTQDAQPTGYKNTTPNLATRDIPANTTATLNFGERAIVDLELKRSVSRKMVGIGSIVTFTYHLKNVGAKDALSVLLQTPVPKGFRYLSAETGGGFYDPASQHTTFASLAAGAEVMVKIRVQATREGIARFKATTLSLDGEEQVANNVKKAAITVVPRTTRASTSAIGSWYTSR